MKLHCILITLAIVNVSPIMTADYANSVYITNIHIKQAYDTDATGLETVISNIINGDKSMKTLNLMLVIPEKANIFRINHDEPFIINLPEQIAIADQVAVQKEICQVTNIPVPKLDQNENIEDDSLLRLGEDRRLITGKVTIKILIAAIIKSEEEPESVSFTGVCRSIGLIRSIKFPNRFIKTADVDSDGICKLTSRDGRVCKYKRTVHGEIVMEILLRRHTATLPNNIANVLLMDQIRNWYL